MNSGKDQDPLQSVDRHSLVRSVGSGLRWTVLSRLVSQSVSWVSTLLAIRMLTPESFGLAAMAGLLAGYLSIWSELGFSVTLLQQRIRDPLLLSRIFGLLLLVGVLLTLLGIATAPALSALFNAPALIPLAQIVAVGFLIMPFSVIPNAQLSMDLRFRALSVVSMISAIAGAGTTILLAFRGYGPYALVLGSLALAFTRAIALNASAPFLRAPAFNFHGLRGFMSFSGSVLATRTVWYWYSESDQLIVGRLMGPQQLGHYSVGRQIAAMPMEKMMEVLNSVSLPAYSALQGDAPRVSAAYTKSIGITALVSVPIFWCIGLLADDLVRTVFGEKWIASIPVVQIMCAVMPIRMIGTLAASPLLALGRADYALRFVLCPALLVPIGLFVGSRWGVTGVAMGWLVAYPVAFLIASVWTRSALRLPLRAIFAPVVPPLACGVLATVMGLLSLLLLVNSQAHAIAKLLVGGTVFATFYAGSMRLLFPPQFAEAFGFARLIAGYPRGSTKHP